MTLPMPTVPSFDLTLPVSKQTIKCRPFLVKEEKILLLALESENTKTVTAGIKQVLENCTFNKIDIGSIPLADVEYLFIKVRSESVGSKIDTIVTCNACKAEIKYNVDLGNVKVIPTEIIDKNIIIDNDTIVTMKYPSLDAVHAAMLQEKDIDDMMLASLIQMITIKDMVYDTADLSLEEVVVWMDNLNKKQKQMLLDFTDNLPMVRYSDQITCKCGAHVDINLEGLDSFFGL
jgi:hypothetical protein